MTWKDAVTEFEKTKSAKTLRISPDAPLMQEVFDVSTKKYAAGSAANGIKQTLFLLDQHAKTNESSFLRAAMPSAPREYAVREVEKAAGVSGPGMCELYALPDLLIPLCRHATLWRLSQAGSRSKRVLQVWP